MAGGWHERPRARDEGRPWHKRAPMRDLFGTKGIRCTKKAPNCASIGLCATLFAHSQAFAPASPPRRRRRPSRQPLPSPPLLRPILPPLLLRLKAVEGVPIRFQARRGGAEEERGEGGKEAERVGQAMNERGPNEGRTTDKQEPISRNRPYRAFCIGVARKRTQPPIASKQAQAAKRALSRPRPQSQARARTKSVARAATVRIAVTRPQTTAGRPRLATAPGHAHS